MRGGGGEGTGYEVAAESEVGAVAGGEREEAGREGEGCERAVETGVGDGERSRERPNLRGHDCLGKTRVLRDYSLLRYDRYCAALVTASLGGLAGFFNLYYY